MKTPKYSISRAVLSLVLLCNGCVSNQQAEDDLEAIFKTPCTPEVLALLEADFLERMEEIRKEGIPTSMDELEQYYPVPAEAKNAAVVYQQAFATLQHTRQLQLLFEAGKMKHYQYPANWKKLSKGNLGGLLDYMQGMRDASRLLGTTAREAVARGDSDAAVQAMTANFEMMRHTAEDPIYSTQLVRSACQGLAAESLDYAMNHATFNQDQLQRLQETLIRAHQPLAMPRALLVEKVLEPDDKLMERMSKPMHYIDAKYLVQLRIAWTALAVERYTLENGHLPETLDELAPVYLDEIPLDPFTAEPVRYRKNEDAYAVYSAGPTGTFHPDLDASTDEMYGKEVVFRVALSKSRPWPTASSNLNKADKKQQKKEFRAAQAVSLSIHLPDPPDGSTISIISWATGALGDGIAVVLAGYWTEPGQQEHNDIQAAFWVKEDVIHTVNAKARDLGPELAAAPKAITLERVLKVAD